MAMWFLRYPSFWAAAFLSTNINNLKLARGQLGTEKVKTEKFQKVLFGVVGKAIWVSNGRVLL